MQTVTLSRQGPRDPTVLRQFDLGFLLRVWTFISWILLSQFLVGIPMFLVGLSQLLAGDTHQPMLVLGGALCTFGAGGMILRRRIARRRRLRERAILEGVLCPARVTAVRPAVGLRLALLGLDTAVHFDIDAPDGRVVKARFVTPDAAWARLVEGERSIHALFDPASGVALLPAEMNRSVVPAATG